MCKKTSLLQDILIQTIDNQLEWESRDDEEAESKTYSCGSTGNSEILYMWFSVYVDHISFVALCNNEREERCYMDIPISEDATTDETLLYALAKNVELQRSCKKSERKSKERI